MDNKRAGVCMHLTSLPGPYGIGEIGRAAREFVDLLGEMGLSVWQFLPLGPTGYGDSPYQSLSAFAGNELLVDIAALREDGLLDAAECARIEGLPDDTVDYGAVQSIKAGLLDAAAERFLCDADAYHREEFEQFRRRHDDAWLHDYALYRILKHANDERPWTEWPEPQARRNAEALAEIASVNRPALERIKVMQFLFHRQWHALKRYAAEQGVALFGDMPIYLALDSADAWSRPELLRIGADGMPDCVAGVPPDYFSADGQLWGNPLYDWSHHAATGYAWWVDRVRHAVELVDLVRIDHFRGFEAFWSVPYGADHARGGQWEPGPGAALFEAIRDALGEVPIVAEDLGVITPEVEALRDAFGLPGMRVLQFEVAEEHFDLAAIPSNSVCYTGTHDNDTTVGWLGGGANDTRSEEELHAARGITLRNAGCGEDEVHLGLIRLAFESAARIAIAPLQDYLGLGSDGRLNIPGTTSDNWRWRLQPGQVTPELKGRVRAMAEAAGRWPVG